MTPSISNDRYIYIYWSILESIVFFPNQQKQMNNPSTQSTTTSKKHRSICMVTEHLLHSLNKATDQTAALTILELFKAEKAEPKLVRLF